MTIDEFSLRDQMKALNVRLAALELDAARFRAIWRGRHDLIVDLDDLGAIRSVSPALLERLGLSAQDCEGRTTFQFTTPEYAHKLAAETPTIFDWVARRTPFELPLVHKNGELVWFEGNIYAYAVDNAINGCATGGFFCIYRDITEAKVLQHEQARLSSSLMESLEVSGVESFEFDVDEGIIAQSAGYSALYGLAEHAANWQTLDDWLQAIHPDDRHLMLGRQTPNTHADVNSAEPPNAAFAPPIVFRVPLQNGKLRHVETRARYLFKANGAVKRVIGAARDVTQAQQAQRAQLENSDRLTLAMSIAGLENYDFNERGHILCSPGYGPLHGLEVGGYFETFNLYLQCVPEPYRGQLAKRFETVNQSEVPLAAFCYPFLGPDNKLRWLESAARYRRDANGELLSVFGSVRDVSQREFAFERERDLVDRLNTALKVGSIESFQWNDKGREYELSEGYQALHGVEPTDLLNEAVLLERIHPDDRARMEERIDTGRRNGGKYPPIIYRVRVGDGYRHVESTAEYIHQNGRLHRIVGVAMDVSQRIAAEQSLKRAKLRAETAIHIGEIGFAEWEKDTGWGEMNQRYRDLLGLDLGEMPAGYETYLKRIHPDDREDFLRRTEKGYATGRSGMGTHRFLRPDGTWVWIESAAHFELSAERTVLRAFIVARDLTFQKATEQSLQSSIERLTAAMQIGQIELFERDLRTHASTYTQGFSELVGWASTKPMDDLAFLALVLPDDRARFQNYISADMQDEAQPLRLRVDSGGGMRSLDLTARHFYDENGSPIRTLCAVRDVTYQAMVEEEIRAQSALFEALIENAPDIIVRIDKDVKVVLVNKALKALLAIDPIDVVGKTLEELPFSAERAADIRARIERCFKTGEGGEFELQFKKVENAPHLLVRYVLEFNSTGDPRFVLVLMRNVTDLKMAEAEAVANARQLGQILETAEEGIVVADVHDRIVFNNPKLEQIFGYGTNELHNQHKSILMLDSADAIWRTRAADRRRGLSESYTQRFRRKDGSTVLGWVNAKPLTDERGEFSGTLAMITDVSELERTESELRHAVEWLEFSMESAQIAGFDLDLENGQARTTALFREWFDPEGNGESPLIAWIKHVHPDDQARIDEQVRTIMDRGSSSRLEFRIIDKNGVSRWIYGVIVTVRNLDGRFARLVFTIVDISERKLLEVERTKLQDQLARTQREESLGTLAAGIAHDINNLLTAAFGQIDMAKLTDSATERAENLGHIEESLSHMAGLSQQMLAYSGRGTSNRRVLDINDALEKIRSILSVSVKKLGRFSIDLFPDKLTVMADESQVQQIAINLLMNATEALDARQRSADGSGQWHPVVSLETGRLAWNQLSLALQSALKPCAVYMFIKVSDNGIGMDDATQNSAMEPFYSSKGSGRGLGLSVVDGIVRSHGGAFVIESELGLGTQCTAYFAGEQIATIRLPGQSSPAQAHNGLILVVDDELSLRNLISRTLNAQGYETLTAADGVQALEVLKQQSDVDLVLLDLTMPEKDGLSVYREIKRLALPVRVVLMSGYSEHAVSQLSADGEAAPAFLSKPFRANDLLGAISQSLATDV